jgi:uncharacterized phage protein (TIGR02218 family)
MSYAARETSRYSGTPFELFWFSMGAQNWYLTSGDIARHLGARTFTPESISATAISQNQELRSGSITILIPRNHAIAALFVGYSPPAPLTLIIYRGHDGELEGETVTYFTGRVATAKFTEHCELTCVPEQDALKRSVPIQKFQSQCNWVLFGPGCGLDKTAYAVSGTVSAISGDTVTVSGLSAKPDGWFRAGWLELGNSRRMIIAHTGDNVTLITPLLGLQVGDAVVAYPGCMLTEAICAGKFGNLVNFWGFSRIPTRNPFNGVE